MGNPSAHPAWQQSARTPLFRCGVWCLSQWTRYRRLRACVGSRQQFAPSAAVPPFQTRVWSTCQSQTWTLSRPGTNRAIGGRLWTERAWCRSCRHFAQPRWH